MSAVPDADETPRTVAGAQPRGWWRTNRWWLVVLVVALAVIGVLTWRTDTVEAWWTGQPHRAHAPGADGWAQVGDVRVRLVGVDEVDWLSDGFDGRVEAPDGYTLWAADLSFRSDLRPGQGASEEAATSCTAALRDSAGREYTAGASGLPGLGYPDPLTCTGAISGRVTQYFLTPDDAEPAQVRVVEQSLLPDYWTLPVDATP